jgi:hypothetical protein
MRLLQSARDICISLFGFFADPTKTDRENYSSYLETRPTAALPRQPTNLQVHNICRHQDNVPTTLLKTLGLGLGYCLSLAREPKNPIDFDRLRRDLRIRHCMAGKDDEGYNPKLYVRNDAWDPPDAPPDVESAIKTFETTTNDLFLASRRCHEPTSNLGRHALQELRAIKREKKFMITATDKNLGPAVLETELYIHRSLKDHLLNQTNYLELSENEALATNELVFRTILDEWVDGPSNNDETELYFTRKLCGLRDTDGIVQQRETLQFQYFYILPKVHKTPWATRPVVSEVSSIQEALSVWLDYYLQQVIHLCPAYLRDSWHFLDRLKTQPTLPADALVFTVDAVGMYSNINTAHALETMQKWFHLHSADLAADYPLDKVLKGLNIIMTHNVFTFGNRHWLQVNGTAMGTSCACAYATIYYSYHEETALLPFPNLLFYNRLIDDAFVVLQNTDNAYTDFVALMNDFGPTGKRLEWAAEDPSPSVNFLDLTVKLTDSGVFETRTFQKPMNLYLYRPPTSAQPTSVLYGLIYGTLHRYFWQNSDRSWFNHFARLFFQRLQARGHSTASLAPLFLKAASRVDESSRPIPSLGPPELRNSPDDRFFLHLQFHPQDPANSLLQRHFEASLLPALEASEIGTQRMTVAYSRAPNIGDLTRRNRLGPAFDTGSANSIP